MPRRRGFFAELQYQNQQAERQRRQQAAAAYRAQFAAQREAERSRLAAEHAQRRTQMATELERARLRGEAVRLHMEAQMADVESRNANLLLAYEEIDGILAATLEVDDYVDLESLKSTADHPPFEPGQDGIPAPPTPGLVYPPEPVYQAPLAPGGLFGAKKKHAALIAESQAKHELTRQGWHEKNVAMYNEYLAKE